jgi:hypothetical protein
MDEGVRDLLRRLECGEDVRERLERAWLRAGLGWSGETLPRDLTASSERGRYVFHASGSPVLELRYVAPGSFTMGQRDLPDRDDAPGHEHLISVPYWIGIRPVAASALSPNASPSEPARATWQEASAFCQRVGLRLPTEAEWEKAARAQDGLPFEWGAVPEWCFEPYRPHAYLDYASGDLRTRLESSSRHESFRRAVRASAAPGRCEPYWRGFADTDPVWQEHFPQHHGFRPVLCARAPGEEECFAAADAISHDEIAWRELEDAEHDRIWTEVSARLGWRPHLGDLPRSVPSVMFAVPLDLTNEERMALATHLLSALRECAKGERIYALDWQHTGYTLDPRLRFHRWLVPPAPDSEDYLFLARDLSWGALIPCPCSGAAPPSITIFGELMIRVFGGEASCRRQVLRRSSAE